MAIYKNRTCYSQRICYFQGHNLKLCTKSWLQPAEGWVTERPCIRVRLREIVWAGHGLEPFPQKTERRRISMWRFLKEGGNIFLNTWIRRKYYPLLSQVYWMAMVFSANVFLLVSYSVSSAEQSAEAQGPGSTRLPRGWECLTTSISPKGKGRWNAATPLHESPAKGRFICLPHLWRCCLVLCGFLKAKQSRTPFGTERQA